MTKPRLLASVLSLSAMGFISLALHEGYTDKAIIPIKDDVPTLGFGQTKDVKMGDSTTPIKALIRFKSEIGEYESAIKRCANVPMTQSEYDNYVNMTYNIGAAAFCRSTMARELTAGNYKAACDAILLYKFASGKDCSKPENKCMGLWTRRLESHKICIGEL